jgi:hypothetical protein
VGKSIAAEKLRVVIIFICEEKHTDRNVYATKNLADGPVSRILYGE